MKYNEAREQLNHALDNQQTIRIPKLKRILESMNVSLSSKGENKEVVRLRRELRKLHRRIRKNGNISR